MLHFIILLSIFSENFASPLGFHGTNSVAQILDNRLKVSAGSTLNQYVDQICVNLNRKINDTGLKTIKLPFSFQQVHNDDKYTLLFSPIVTVSLINGSLSNIGTFERDGDANINYINKNLILSSSLKLGSLTFEYDAKMKLSGFGPTKHISRSLEGFTANVTLSIDAATLTVHFDGLDVFHTGSITDISNDSDEFADQILYYIDSYMQNQFNKALNSILKTFIRAKLNKINNL